MYECIIHTHNHSHTHAQCTHTAGRRNFLQNRTKNINDDVRCGHVQKTINTMFVCNVCIVRKRRRSSFIYWNIATQYNLCVNIFVCFHMDCRRNASSHWYRYFSFDCKWTIGDVQHQTTTHIHKRLQCCLGRAYCILQLSFFSRSYNETNDAHTWFSIAISNRHYVISLSLSLYDFKYL